MLLDSTGSGRLGGAAAAGGGRDALSYGVSFATTRSHQLARGAALPSLVKVARARPFPQLPQLSGPARCCSRRSGRLGGAAAAGGGRDALSYGVSFATTRSHQLARGAPACFLSGISGWFSLSLGAWVPKESGAAKNGLRAQLLNNALTECLKRGRVNLLSQGRARATFSATSATLRAGAMLLEAIGPPWAVQPLRAAAATLSATGSASRRPDGTSWLGGLRRSFSPAFRAGSLYPLARGCRRIWRGEKQGDC